MDKNEILSKSRKENVYGDEREKEVRVKSNVIKLSDLRARYGVSGP